jgi:hypothetical protein
VTMRMARGGIARMGGAAATHILTRMWNGPSMARGREELCDRCGGVFDIGTPVCPHCGRAAVADVAETGADRYSTNDGPRPPPVHPVSRDGGPTRDRRAALGPFVFGIVGGWLLIMDAFLAGIFGIIESSGNADLLVVVALFGGSVAGILGGISVLGGWLRGLAMIGPTFLTIAYLVVPRFDGDLVAISAFGIFLAVASLFFIVMGWESIKARGRRGARRMDVIVKGSFRP